MKNISLVVSAVFFGLMTSVSATIATIPPPPSAQEITSAFQKYKDVSAPSIKVPTVVEVPFANDFSNRFDFAVIDTEGNVPQPYLFTESLRSARTAVSIDRYGGENSAMLDGNTRTFTEFALPQSGQGQTRLVLMSTKPMTLSGMTFFLDQFVALPTSIEIRANTDSGEKIVLARSQMFSGFVSFPKTTAKEWTVSFTYGQMLRITEIVLNDETAGMVGSRTLRFLAQPKHNYRIYFDADRSVPMHVGEAGNLISNIGVLRLADSPAQANAGYVLADTDSDGIPDLRDNCVSTANANQVDVDGNGRGDVCDDFDRDGIANAVDNCPNDPNYNQADIDGDKIGDVCDKEESRITEKYPWLPMAGIGFAGVVLVVLFTVTAQGMMKKSKTGQ